MKVKEHQKYLQEIAFHLERIQKMYEENEKHAREKYEYVFKQWEYL